MKQIVLAMVFVLLAGAMAAQAQSVPPLVNYQGMLTDASDNPQTGTKKLEFNLYDAATGGNKVWGPQVFDSVPLVNGMFNVILGTTDANGKSIADAFSAKDRYLGMKVDGGTELAPRQQILSTPFAINAQNAILIENKTLSQLVCDFRTPDYDSGWFAEDSLTSHVTSKTHNLGVYPSRIAVWFSTDNPPSGYIISVPLTTHAQQGGIESLRVDTSKVEYSIIVGEIIGHWWDIVEKSYKSGYYRVLLWK